MVRRRRRPTSKEVKPGPRSVDKRDARMTRWNTLADIPMDEEDQFHTTKDRILLEGEEVGADDDGDEEEVFALEDIPSSDSEEDNEEDEEEEEEEEEEPQPKARESRKGKAKAKPPPESDNEEKEESEEESWGHKKSAYYSSNAAELDSEDEEANELEEQEARRIQAKARDGMVDDDYGLADIIALEDTEGTEDPLLEPALVVTTHPVPLDKKAALRLIEKTNPETLALAYDWEDIAVKVVRTQEKIKELASTEPESQALGMAHLHNQALLTYATTLAFYLYLRASEYYSQHPELLRSHPILSRLLQLKQALTTLEELDFQLSESDSWVGDSEDEDISLEDEEEKASSLLKRRHKGSQLAFDDLAELLREAEEATSSAKTRNKSDPIAPPPIKEPPKKKRKTTAGTKSAPVFDLDEPTYVPSKPRTSRRPFISAEDNAFGDPTVLGVVDAADKQARRHTLRFHTSKIENSSARRQGARLALGGDDDVPYRERRKEKEARAQREAQVEKRGQGGDDLDDAEPELPARATRGVDMSEDEESIAESEDGYYSLIQKQKREQKESKKMEYEAAKAESRMDDDDDDGAEGPRSLTRAILKNRGLTPRRSKSVRNPRVKKRQKFAKAKKVIASQKSVFKPGAGDSTWYGGERSGISTVTKSVRF
ncbi:Sas10 C-terminal domain-containing protein [Multifurca ochricompacta]|uniref:Sas10 C-terminal domain-containing protein n=1 Tax=Multifurca ochricompacta TaxID=376703 RepID=A0AAD4M3Y1_9AGAM|nr:Sas10 C-terminal domain-containing protein [Multifurca ochricompacta]